MSPNTTGNSNLSDSYNCSFCGRPQESVGRLIAGPSMIFICDQCVLRCQQVIDTDKPDRQSRPKLTTPQAIFNRLNEYVIGQELAKRVISVGVYNHYKRIRWGGDDQEVELHKTILMLVGPTGSGKTYMAQTLAKILDVPFAMCDATSLTEAGYVGEDVENILLSLIRDAQLDMGRAEQGIIYIDEIDKIARKAANPSITRDVSGEGVQQALLKILEGCVTNVPPQGGRKHPHQEFIQINTGNVLFILGGAFEGLDDIINRRLTRDRATMGFGWSVANDRGVDAGKNDLACVSSDDLIQYGFIPEFVGRIPLIVSLSDLTRDELIRVLSQPKNALVRQYQALFKMDGVDLEFEEGALSATAEFSIQHKSGARGLRTVLEETLLDVMYELPSLDDVAKCLIEAETITERKPPILLDQSGKHLVDRLPATRSAA